ncbi:hypothetical protein DEO72_LG7g1979 [Vigna unguiculata]|uniref:Uncharacterized protein n=1 Tax=Vigna unguiculata TaxID=3917 RepID=A0A4D6MKJ9_VIGUN|nr:hypothetical protein DEO72_LG7g1979 [Vigna unguiculata]
MQVRHQNFRKNNTVPSRLKNNTLILLCLSTPSQPATSHRPPRNSTATNATQPPKHDGVQSTAIPTKGDHHEQVRS